MFCNQVPLIRDGESVCVMTLIFFGKILIKTAPIELHLQKCIEEPIQNWIQLEMYLEFRYIRVGLMVHMCFQFRYKFNSIQVLVFSKALIASISCTYLLDSRFSKQFCIHMLNSFSILHYWILWRFIPLKIYHSYVGLGFCQWIKDFLCCAILYIKQE